MQPQAYQQTQYAQSVSRAAVLSAAQTTTIDSPIAVIQLRSAHAPVAVVKCSAQPRRSTQ